MQHATVCLRNHPTSADFVLEKHNFTPFCRVYLPKEWILKYNFIIYLFKMSTGQPQATFKQLQLS